ncbi:TPR-like protein [Lindgomyces ingoldianus]|uniref:TPR-like protein n=1 Tax=Lindgomyces ingoldianus TaxID=673940 RepID=A0ACB6QUC2_9PLEO|nr:TPR-like protein [Lindgomyces ingoldianus]KAF2470490.1 TPR-like protein [Lindgomyces ingoldianus]
MASHADFDSAHDLLDLDIATLRQYVEFYPQEGLSKVLTGYLSSGISKFPLTEDAPEAPDLSEGGVALNQDVPVTQEDCLVMMTEGILQAKASPLAHCLLGDYYLSLEEYESAVETTRKGLGLAAAAAKKTDLNFQRIRDALNSTLATALIYYQTPKNHPEAKEIFLSILGRKPQFTPALIGIGLILEEEEEYAEAIDFLEKALEQDPANGRIGAEAAWCQALSGDYRVGLVRLEDYLDYPQMDASKQRGRELRAQTLYRIGVCMWEINPSPKARKDRHGAYAKFLASIKANPNFAPAYTKLGIFYEEYNKDRRRSRQCFQKAFELSPSEVFAAECLAHSFANQGEWDIVEVIAQRVVDSGKVRPTPGSKTKKAVSWPFSALGVVQMNKQEYQKSIVSFLSALRINPNDYHSYVGLGESYHNSGRYNSASRTFNYAENPTDGVVMKKTGESWFTKYMLANVNRELGEFDDAIKGYEDVLSERPREFGVAIALLQSLVEKSWRCIETGFFGEAADSACRAVGVASSISEYKSCAFNLWKAVGDACAVFTQVQEKLDRLPFTIVEKLLRVEFQADQYDAQKELDGIGSYQLNLLAANHHDDMASQLARALHASILAQKRAIVSCANDVHAQAVAWYNLGWMEYRAHVCLEQEQGDSRLTIFLRAAMKCFKRAIELEAGNAEFWNSLGVVTTTLNPKVAQHAFVRSLHLNERSVRTWTNIGTLYLLQNDSELAHLAFSRAQSTDPDYALAWVGEGIIALLYGDRNEALSHFTHAFELSDSQTLLTKRQYANSTFDYLVSAPVASNNITNLIQPLFALQQLMFQAPYDIPHKHLAALFFERIGNYKEACKGLKEVCEAVEKEYEAEESPAALCRFAMAKSDLSRNLLAVKEFADAAEEAETALDLLSEDVDADPSALSTNELNRIRLSARLTAGLSHYYLSAFEHSISYFRKCLEVDASNPDVIVVLAEVLWAKGGQEEKEVAREQLLEAVQSSPEHVGAVTLLGVIAALDGDVETMEAVRDDLAAMRTTQKQRLSAVELMGVEKLIDAIAILLGDKEEQGNEVRRSVMLAPWKSVGWQMLAGATEEVFPAIMARDLAVRSVPPGGELDAVALAKGYAGTGFVEDAVRSVITAPWRKEGWVALGEGLGGFWRV